MKTGEVAKKFSKDPKTIRSWTDEFSDFFSPQALGKEGDQRDYSPGDIVTLNTIRLSKGRDMTSEQIAARLRAKDFDSDLPPDFQMIEGDNALAVYSQMKSLEVLLNNANSEIERLRQQIADDRKHYEGRIEQLIRQSTEWEIRYKMLKAKNNDKEYPDF
jgi:DNA-binding transcriptional MerR regulator